MGEVVIVCGGRDWKDWKETCAFLDAQHAKCRIDLMVTGAAKGADTLADRWAQANGVARAIFPANWDGEGRSAGHSRNERMLRNVKPVHRVIAFPGGRGTASMIEKAEGAGVPVTLYRDEAERMLG